MTSFYGTTLSEIHITSPTEMTSLVSNLTSLDDVINEPQLQIVENGNISKNIEPQNTKNGQSELSYFRSLTFFYQTPAVKFLIHLIHFIFALPTYSYLFLYIIRSSHIGQWEEVLMLCNLCYFIESLDILIKFQGPIKLKLTLWFRSEWNLIQAASSLLGMIAFVLKLVYLQVS